MLKKANAFDIDGNLFHTNLPHLLEKKTEEGRREVVEMPYENFKDSLNDKENYRLIDGDLENSFEYARGYGKIVPQLLDALTNKDYGPSRESFKKANIEANLVWINTARGHPLSELREAHKALLFEGLSLPEKDVFKENMQKRLGIRTTSFDSLIQKFLDENHYVACSDKDYLKSINNHLKTLPKTRENYSTPAIKALSYKLFLDYFLSLRKKYQLAPSSLEATFSDDCPKNIQAVTEKVVQDIFVDYPQIQHHIIFTGNPEHPIKRSYVPASLLPLEGDSNLHELTTAFNI